MCKHMPDLTLHVESTDDALASVDDRDLGRTAGDDLSVVSDMSVVRDLLRKRGREDGGADDTGSASRDNGTSKR